MHMLSGCMFLLILKHFLKFELGTTQPQLVILLIGCGETKVSFYSVCGETMLALPNEG